MRLAEFIRSHREAIIGEWESFARTLQPASDDMSPLALRNHIQQILAFVADDIETPQSGHEQEEKSRGLRPRNLGKGKYSAAETHAALRLAGGFHMDQMVSEYRALRASITKLWAAEHTEMDDQDVVDQTRFNEAVDQALTESISHYTKMLDHSKDLFLAIMGHDLRNPLGAILTSAQLTLKIGRLDDRQKMLLSQITESASRANEIVHHLLDLTRARFGSGLPIIAAPMDFGFVSRLMVDEIRAAHPGRKFNLEITGDMDGSWDKARIGQVFSNLLGNAVQYSFQETPIDVTVTGTAEEVVLSVHNLGVPIPREKAARIFDALTRGVPEDAPHDEQEESEPLPEPEVASPPPKKAEPANLGLGLYITKEIVTAHGGFIDVTSSEKEGTTFSAHFPR